MYRHIYLQVLLCDIITIVSFYNITVNTKSSTSYHIIGTQTIEQLLTEHSASKLQEVSVAKLRKMTRCMRLLENVSLHSTDVQFCFSLVRL